MFIHHDGKQIEFPVEIETHLTSYKVKLQLFVTSFE